MSVFQITIQRRSEEGWPVVVSHQPGAGALTQWSWGRLELDLEDLEPLLPSDRGYGLLLGKALFREDVRDAFVRARAEARIAGEPLRVLLIVEAGNLRRLHWGQLCAPLDRGWDYLTLNQDTPFSRYLPTQIERRFPPIGRRDLRALLLVAGPEELDRDYNLAPFDVAATVESIEHALGEIPCDLLASLDRATGPPSLNALCEQLTTGRYTLLHVVCHGAYLRDTGETILYFPGETDPQDGGGRPVLATELIERLSRLARLPHFTFLSTCESADPQAEIGLGGLGQRLVRELGTPAVVAMTDRISIATAEALASAFYARLGEHGEVDRALCEALAGLQARYDVTVPALFSRLGGRPLFSDALDRPLTEAEIGVGLDQLQTLLKERAPVLLPEFEDQAAKVRATLGTDEPALSAETRLERQAALAAINQLCSQALDLSFNALALGQEPPAYDTRCPFPGLLPFGTEDHEFFFGREALVKELAARLVEQNFLAVLGPSGCGKSSLVLAGLVPALEARFPQHKMTYLQPDYNPLAQLEAALASRGTGVSGGDQRALPVAADQLVVVDQFEELFTLCTDEAERQAFVERLLALSRTSRVVLTLRADFWGECVAYPALKDEMQAHQELVAPMDATALRQAMERQADHVGLRFEAGLGEAILDDVAGEPGAMPLLQHALLLLWNRRHGRWLRWEEYRAFGGIRQAIAHTADEVYAKLTGDEKERVRDIFLRLTALEDEQPGGEGRDTRRRVELTELVPAGSDPGETVALVKRLADARLVVTGVNAASGKEEVEVAHEALIRHWPRLRSWLDENRASLLTQRRLTRAAKEWERSEREGSYLYQGARLTEVEAWAETPAAGLNPSEQAFLKASIQAREAGRIASRRRRQGILAAVMVVVVVIGLLVGWTISEQNHAQRQESRLLAKHSQDLLEADYDLALLLAVEAGHTASTFESEAALHRSLVRQRPARLLSGHTASVKHAAWDGTGTHVVTSSEDGTARLWNPESGAELQTLAGHKASVEVAAWDGAGRRIVTASRDGTARIWDAESGAELAVLEGHTSQVNYVAWSPDDTMIVSTSADGTARVWEVSTAIKEGGSGAELAVFMGHGDLVYQAAWDPAGKRIVTVDDEGFGRVWDAASGTELLTLTGHTDRTLQVAWNQDGTRIVTASVDGTARVWDAETGSQVAVLQGHQEPVHQVAWNGAGTQIVTAGADNTVRLWEAESGSQLLVLVDHAPGIVQAGWTAADSQITATGADGRAWLWDAESGEAVDTLPSLAGSVLDAAWDLPGMHLVTTSGDGNVWVRTVGRGIEVAVLAGHTGAIRHAAWNEAGTQIVTASDDDTARVWHAETGHPVSVFRGHSAPVRHAAWNRTGTQIVTTSDDGTARLWDAQTGAPVAVLEGHTASVLRAAWNEAGTRIVTASSDGTAGVWDAATGARLATLLGHTARVFHAAWNPAGTLIVTASEDGTARLWEGEEGAELAVLAHEDAVYHAAWNGNGTHIVTTSSDGRARVWKVKTALNPGGKGAEGMVLAGHEARVVHAAWNGAGTRLVTASWDDTARVWNARNGAELAVLAGHVAGVSYAVWSPDDRRIVTVSDDGTARLWDAQTGAPVAVLEGHTAPVLGAAWNADGTRLVTASSDGTARVYYTQLPELLEVACQRAARNMSLQEWNRYMGGEPCRATCPELPAPEACSGPAPSRRD